MRFSNLVHRVGGKGADAWEIHYAAQNRQRHGESIIILSIGQEMLETTPQLIIDSAFDSLNRGRHHYSDISGEPQLRNALAKFASDQMGISVSVSNCAVFSGAQNALFAASLCTLGKGDEAIIIEPYYATYPATFSAGGAKVITVPTSPEDDFMLRADDVLEQITDRTRSIVINCPHNPAGVIYSNECIDALVEVCKKQDIWLISDEVYSSLVASNGFRSPASIPGAFERCITVSSVSKSHRMTGWRVGWIIADEALIKHLFNLSICMSYGLPMFIQDAAETALEHAKNISQIIRNEIDQKRSMVVAKINRIKGIQVRGSKFGMFVTFDIRKLGISATDFAWRLLDEYQVALLPCIAFGQSGKGILRMNIGESESNLKIACNSINDLACTLVARTTD